MARRYDIIGSLDVTGSGFKTQAVTVGNTATALPTTPLANRKSIAVRNNSGTVTIYVGGSDVTTANGYPVLPYEGLPFNMSSGALLYGITASGTADVRVLEIDNG